MTQTNGTMRVDDLGFITVATLRGFKWLSLQDVRGRVWAEYERTPDLLKLREEFIQDLVLLPVKSVLNTFRSIKSLAVELAEYHQPTNTNRRREDHAREAPDAPQSR